MCVDDADVQGVLSRIRDRRIVTYGTSALADLRADNIVVENGGSRFDISVRQGGGERRLIEGVFVPMPGRHNVLNALAAIAVGMEFGFSDEVLKNGFKNFAGVKRRFTKVGEVDGATIIDDYAHHPVEIRSVLAAAREAALERVIAVVQPHRYTRLRDLMDDFQNAFNDADVVFVAPVYAAGEEPIEGIDGNALAEGLRSRGHRMVKTVDSLTDLAANLRDLAAEGDIVICMGAGDITKWAGGLAPAIAAARAAK
jgi:UDP-N-acetylmuramate--alanine ligase